MRNRSDHFTSTLSVVALVVFCGGLLLSASLAAQWDQSKANRGARMFRAYCASCHGETAQGDGEIAELLRVKPANLTEIAKRNDGKYDMDQVVKVIDGRTRVKGHGDSQMPIWGDAFQVADGGNTMDIVEARIENLANYLWSVQK